MRSGLIRNPSGRDSALNTGVLMTFPATPRFSRCPARPTARRGPATHRRLAGPSQCRRRPPVLPMSSVADQASKTATGRRGIGLLALVALGTVVAVACGGGRRDSGNGLPAPVVTADCETRKAQIEGQTTGVTVTCNPDNTMTLTSDNGLPNHDMMHGIVNWIDRVPVCA